MTVFHDPEEMSTIERIAVSAVAGFCVFVAGFCGVVIYLATRVLQ